MLTKYISLGIIFLACGCTGAFLSRAMLLRVRELESALRMLASLRAQLQYSRPSLERMFDEICANRNCPAFLPDVLAQLRRGEAFPTAWRESLSHAAYLQEDDRRTLYSLGELLGSTDAAGQCEALLMQEALLQNQLEQARARRDTRGKAMFSLGILAGLTVLILFV